MVLEVRDGSLLNLNSLVPCVQNKKPGKVCLSAKMQLIT